MREVLFSGMRIFPLGGVHAPSVSLGPLITRKLQKVESQNFTHIFVEPSTLFRYKNFSARGLRGHSAP